MHLLNKLRILLAVSLIILIIFKIIIPGYKEIKRQNAVDEEEVKKFQKNSISIEIKNFRILSDSSAVYFDGTPFIKKYSLKEISLIKDLETSNVYKIELFHPSALILIAGKKNIILSLTINKKDLQNKGTIQNPIIALRYSTSSNVKEFVNDENYIFNIREYLTYKDYVPPIKNTFYYLTMAWAFITIFGFAIITGILTRKGYMNEQGGFNKNGPANKIGK